MKSYIVIVLLVIVAAAAAAPPAHPMSRGLGSMLGRIRQVQNNLKAVDLGNKMVNMKSAMAKVFEVGPDGHWGKASVEETSFEWTKKIADFSFVWFANWNDV